MFTTVEMPDEARVIAESKAAEAGLPLADWLTAAVSQHAARQNPVEDMPFDDCGFYSPYSLAVPAG